jgi:hypothetical protein
LPPTQLPGLRKANFYKELRPLFEESPAVDSVIGQGFVRFLSVGWNSVAELVLGDRCDRMGECVLALLGAVGVV